MKGKMKMMDHALRKRRHRNALTGSSKLNRRRAIGFANYVGIQKRSSNKRLLLTQLRIIRCDNLVCKKIMCVYLLIVNILEFI